MNAIVYRKADGTFLGFQSMPTVLVNGEPVPDTATYGELNVPSGDTVDPRLERFDATSPTGRRAATTAEVTTYDAAQRDARAARADDDLLIQAVAQMDFEERQKLQVKAGQTLLTAAQCRARVRAIYRSLLGS